MFGLSTQMALDPTLEERLFWRLVRAYRWQLFKSSPRLYLDKSHPNMWIAERLKDAFRRSVFIGIERNPYATIASMLKHGGVRAWHSRWREFPIPNRFLGITQELAYDYDKVPLVSRCAMRWVAHRDRMKQLNDTLQDDILIISYESFVQNTEQVIGDLQVFLGLHEPIPIPEVRTDSLDKWKSQLSNEQVTAIQELVGFGPSAIDPKQAAG